MNKFLDAVNANIFEIQREYTLKKEPVTALQVRAKILHTTEEKQHTLIEVYQYHNDQFKQSDPAGNPQQCLGLIGLQPFLNAFGFVFFKQSPDR
ncbi:MAG: hypothetical protein WDO19_20155 [Bacteroidota bacterium]